MLCRCQSLAQSCCHRPRQGVSRTLGNRALAAYQRDPSRPQAVLAGVVRLEERLSALKETWEKTGASKLDVSELGGKVDALGKGLLQLEVELAQLKGEIVGGVGVQGFGLKGQVLELGGQLDKLGAEITKIKAEIAGSNAEIKAEIASSKAEVKAEITEVAGQLGRQRNLLLFFFVVLVVLADWQSGLDKVKILFDLSKGIL